MALSYYFYTLKFSGEDRSQIGFIRLPPAMSDANILEMVADLEALTLDLVSSAVGSGGRVIGLSEFDFYTRANQSVNEEQDLAKNPVGVNGKLLTTATIDGEVIDLVSPFNLKGLNQDFVVPAGYPVDGSLEDQVAFLMKKYGKVVDINEDGSVSTYVIDQVVVTRKYQMQ